MKKPIPFGKYVLLDRINVGGMAEVFKAKAFGVEGFERLIAVKRILPSIAEDKEFITMFTDEAKIAVELTHANIAQIFDLGRVGDSYFIAMEHVHGKDLRAIFDRARKRGEPLPVPMACYCIMKVCEGLDYAHNKRDGAGRDLHIVHRDVSPQNLLISYDGEVKIIDFGIAKAAGKVGKTQAGILKGKFGYMSPEQVRGLPLDRRSDIFAVGICLYELLTGERLFVGESDFSTLEKVRNVEIMPPSTYNRRIPEELEQIVLKALAKDVDDRYQTAMDLHDDLQSFMYTSGNFFARKDLSAYQRKMFAEEIAKETARDEQYRRLEAPAQTGPEVRSGLAAFDDLAPGSRPAPGAYGAAQGAGAQGLKRTMMGMGAVPPPPPPRTSNPPPLPPRGSSQPARPSSPGASSSPGAPSSPGGRPAGGAVLQMDWDDDELSTQIYDKPDGSPMMGPNGSAGPAFATSSSAPQSSGPAHTAAGPPHLLSGGPSSGPPRGAVGASSAPPFVPGVGRPGASLPGPSARPSPQSGGPPLVSSGPPGPGRPPTGPIQFPPSRVPHGAPSPFDLPSSKPSREPTSLTRTEDKAGSNRGVLLALAIVSTVAIVGGLAAVGWMLLGPRAPATLLLSTDPPDAVVLFDARPVPTTTSPYLIENIEPGEHLVEVTKPGFRRWSQQLVLEAGETRRLDTVTLLPIGGADAVEGTGFTLSTVPTGAKVLVDGRELEERTPVQVTDLSPGTHQVRVEHGGRYAPWETRIDVAAGSVQALAEVTLRLRSATVQFRSEPAGAAVTLERGSERRSIGSTPTSADVELTGAAWTVVMSRDGYDEWREELAPEAGEDEVEVRARLTEESVAAVRPVPRPTMQRTTVAMVTMVTMVTMDDTPPTMTTTMEDTVATGTGTLQINTVPWSQVYIDGQLVGNTPQMGLTLRAGTHRVTLVNTDFDIRHTISVEIRAGQTERRVVQLPVGG